MPGKWKVPLASLPVNLAASPTCDAPARQHGDAAALRQLLEPLLPGQHVLDAHEIVGILLGLLAHIDDGERHHQLAGDDRVGGGAVFREMDRRIEMGAGVLDDPPPVQVEAVLLELVLLLQLDARHAEEGREVRRHGVGEIDHALEVALPSGALVPAAARPSSGFFLAASAGSMTVAAKPAAAAPLKNPRRLSAACSASWHPGTHMIGLLRLGRRRDSLAGMPQHRSGPARGATAPHNIGDCVGAPCSAIERAMLDHRRPFRPHCRPAADRTRLGPHSPTARESDSSAATAAARAPCSTSSPTTSPPSMATSSCRRDGASDASPRRRPTARKA